MTDSPFSPAVLPGYTHEPAPPPLPLDKRLVGERNRMSVLSWVSRFGWLTSRMVAALVWSNAAQSLTMARRTLKNLCDERLLVARALSKGGAAYVLSAKGARLLQEVAGIAAQSGHALAIGNPTHRACSNWYLIHAIQRGLTVVTEHEIATGRGPCRVLYSKVADGLVVADDGACIWVECEHSQKARAERHKTVTLVQECIGGERQVELGPGLWLARVAVVATNETALRWMAASFQDAHRRGLIQDSQIAEVEACLLPVSESLVTGDLVAGNMWWDVLVPATT